jgi:signal peptidase I
MPTAPSPLLRILFALLGYSSVHWAAGRWRRALFWDAMVVVAAGLAFWLPTVPFLLLGPAHIVDAALITPVRPRTTKGYFLIALLAFGIATLASTAMHAWWIESFQIPGGAMAPSVLAGDRILVARGARHPHRGDVIVFAQPVDPDKDLIKRVIAVGGDTVEQRADGSWLVNGEPIARRHVAPPCQIDDFVEERGGWITQSCDAWDETLDGRTYRVALDSALNDRAWGPKTVAPNSYFVLGDNRDNSNDSRYFGFVPAQNIKGVARKIWWSQGPHGLRKDRLDLAVR